MHNSPLSEFAALGFEYGYAVAVPNGLVAWEAQFGDFVNGAQVIIDQFLVAGLPKWEQTSRLTLLLRTATKGTVPSTRAPAWSASSSSRAGNNIRIANCTTPAQYFHLLRLQAHGSTPRPLVIFTPKSLLRLSRRRRASTAELGSFRSVFDDLGMSRKRSAALLLCSGKVYDIVGHESYAQARPSPSLARPALPVPGARLRRAPARVPVAEEIVWVQEEPQNMGAFRSIRHRLEESLPEGIRSLRRPPVASSHERGLPHRPLGRAGGSSSKRSANCSVLTARRPARPPSTCFFACSKTSRRCAGGSLRQELVRCEERARWSHRRTHDEHPTQTDAVAAIGRVHHKSVTIAPSRPPTRR